MDGLVLRVRKEIAAPGAWGAFQLRGGAARLPIQAAISSGGT